MEYYMGIDNGGTLAKAVIFDTQGNEISVAQHKLKLEIPAPGYTERDMNYLWECNIRVIRESLQKAGLTGKDIKGISCTGHGKGLYLWGKNGNPAYKGIVSTDSRARKYPDLWKKNGIAEQAFEKTFQDVLPSQPVSLLNWLKEYEPGVIESTRWIFEVKDYIRFKLTGEAFAEITDYSGSNLMNLQTSEFDPELLRLFGLEDCIDKLPPLKKSTEICGYISQEVAEQTGLAEGTLVSGGMFDIDACSIAMNICDEKNLCVIAGTWSINEYISKSPVLNKTVMMNSLYCLDDFYLIEECSPTSAGNLEWFVETFLEKEKKEASDKGVNIFQYCDQLAEEVDPEEMSVYFLPFIFGSNDNPNARSCFIGMDRSQSRAHLVRAVFEGIVFTHMIHIEKLLINRPLPSSIRLAGGAANSSVWGKIFADVSGLPVEIVDIRELGALGCAMTAAVADGVYPDLTSAARRMVRIKKKIYPETQMKLLYDKKFNLFKNIVKSLDPLWEEFR